MNSEGPTSVMPKASRARQVEPLLKSQMHRLGDAIDVGADHCIVAIFRMRRLLERHRRQQAELDVVGAHPLHEAGGTLPLGDVQRRALIEAHQQQPLRVHVIEGRRCQDVAVAPAVPERVDLAGADPVALRQHAALGKAGGSRCILDVEQVVVANLLVDEHGRRRVLHQLLQTDVTVVGIIRHHQLAAIELELIAREHTLDAGKAAIIGDQELRLAVGQDEDDLALAVAVVDRHHDGADGREGEPRQRHRRHIRHHHRHVSAAPDTDGAQAVGQRVDTRHEITVRQRLPALEEVPGQRIATRL